MVEKPDYKYRYVCVLINCEFVCVIKTQEF